MRILSKKRITGQKDVVFYSDDEPRVRVKAKIVWCQRLGYRNYLAGLQFIDLPLDEAKKLLLQAAYGVTPGYSTAKASPARGGWGLAGTLMIILAALTQFMGASGRLEQFGLMANELKTLHFIMYLFEAMGLTLVLYAISPYLIISTPKRRSKPTVYHGPVHIKDREYALQMLNSIIQSALGGVLILKAVRDEMDKIKDFIIQTANPASEQLLGRSTTDLIGQRLLETLPCLAKEGLFDIAVSVVETGLPHQASQQLNHDRRWYRYTAVKLRDGIALTFDDISEQRFTEDKLRHAAYHDTLTGLPNRKMLTEHLLQAIHRVERVQGYRFAVLFLDFDRFKIINDSLGHEAGDQLLLGITKRLRDNLRELDLTARLGDGHLPSRLGGDEFVVLLEGVKDERSAAVVAQRLLDAFAEPYHIKGHEVTSTASIGIVVSDPRYTTPDDILRDADTAMYHAKSTGKARYVMFDELMHKSIMNRLTLENELRVAVEAGAFEVVYEPIVCLASGRLCGVEALIRWPHPRRGEVPPGEFIEIAEELGLIVPIGMWVLRAACKTFVKWQNDHADQAPQFINVNVARSQLRDPGLIGHVHAAILETGIKPEALRLEITESMVMDDLEEMAGVLGKLKELGVGLAMDDFGTGHSSLTCLHRFPLDFLKIDRSFINSAGRKERHYGAILHSVIELAKNLDMAVIAEGIENPSQLALLQGLGCQYGQGYLFSGPIPAEQTQELLERDFTQFKAA